MFFNIAAKHFLPIGFLNHLVSFSLFSSVQFTGDLIQRLIGIDVPEAGAERVRQRRGYKRKVTMAQSFVFLGVGVAYVHDHIPV